MIPSYGISLLVAGLTGVMLNFLIILKFLSTKKNSMSSFHKLCLFKAIPNLIISSSFPFWICPLSFLEYKTINIPRSLNVFIAEFVGIFCYYFAPLILICMSLNRFIAIYFPFSSPRSFPFTNCAILGCLVLASGPVLVPKFYGCSFIYDPELGIFITEDVEKCGPVMDSFIIYSILAMAFFSNGFNLAIFAKLVKDKMLGISEDQKNKRKKKWQAMYVQSVIQDFLQVLDIINFNVISSLIDSPIWYFLFSTFSFVCIYALDGAVMIYFYTDSRIFCWKKKEKKSSTFVSGMQVPTSVKRVM